MWAANSDYTRCSIPKARQSHCLPPASAGNCQLIIMVYTQKVKTQLCISHHIQTTFFYLGRFLKKSADDQCSSIFKAVSVISNIDLCVYNLLPWEWIRRLINLWQIKWDLHCPKVSSFSHPQYIYVIKITRQANRVHQIINSSAH